MYVAYSCKAYLLRSVELSCERHYIVVFVGLMLSKFVHIFCCDKNETAKRFGASGRRVHCRRRSCTSLKLTHTLPEHYSCSAGAGGRWPASRVSQAALRDTSMHCDAMKRRPRSPSGAAGVSTRCCRTSCTWPMSTRTLPALSRCRAEVGSHWRAWRASRVALLAGLRLERPAGVSALASAALPFRAPTHMQSCPGAAHFAGSAGAEGGIMASSASSAITTGE